jgi:hypothetical protein
MFERHGAIFGAMTDPIPIYIVSGYGPNEKYGAAIGDFVYVSEGFRYLDTQVTRALTTAPPVSVVTPKGRCWLAKLHRSIPMRQ